MQCLCEAYRGTAKPGLPKRWRDIKTIPLPERRAKAMEHRHRQRLPAKAPEQNDMRGKTKKNSSKKSRIDATKNAAVTAAKKRINMSTVSIIRREDDIATQNAALLACRVSRNHFEGFIILVKYGDLLKKLTARLD
jgi:hypothetical protein